MERQNYYPGTEALYHGLVDASGIDGANGSNGMDGMPGGSGAPGSPGTNATPATNGGNAREMKVKLSRRIYHDSTRIEAHCLTPSNTPSKQEWLLQAQDMILLRAKGGNGGHGGHGGNGGDGGRGMDGVSSNEYQSGTRGGSGGSGGNGGNGTSGGNGGSGAYIEIEVEEDDMDLLVPIHWDVRGGLGGNAGSNGSGGNGGRPGHGGKGSGSRGMHGSAGNAILTAGQYGQPGNARIQVHMKSTRELGARHNFYTSRYFFTLVDFDIVDENEDGIYEPGEHIYVQNIRIQNTGGMPTPTQQPIPMHLVASAWFEIYEGEAAFIPPGIPEGQTVTVKDRLRARIKYPPEPWGRPFREKTQIEFHAALPGLNGRIIRDFSGKRDVILSYPISIETTRWANSVLTNTRMSVVWMITNKSTRALGRSSEQARNVEYIFRGNRGLTTDTELTLTDCPGLERIVDIDYLAPGDTRTYTQEIVVQADAEQYKHHNFDLVLCLGRPRSTQKDVVQVGNIKIQVASPYIYQPTASFLLVVNCETTGQQVQSQRILFSGLGVIYDTWNVSLYGGYNRPTDGANVLNSYFGKGLVLFGEDFDFFQQNGKRNAADMISSELGFALANHGTNILFVGSPSQSIDAWAKAVTFPQFGSDPVPFTNKKEVIIGLRAAGLHNPGASIPISASRISKTKGTFEKRAAKTSKLLKTKFPLERFQIYPGLQDPNVVIVRQSLPVASRLMVCSGPPRSLGTLDSLHLVAVVSSLPIATRMRMLFAMLAPEAFLMKGGEISSVTDLLVPQAIKLSIIHELELEIARYLHEAPWPHRISTVSTANVHLKSFHAFIGAWPWESLDQDRTNCIAEIFTHVLNAVRLSGFGEHVIRFGFRKTNLRNYIVAKIKDFLTARTQNGVELMKQLGVQASDDKRFVKTSNKITSYLQIPEAELATRWSDSFHEGSKVLNIEEAASSQALYIARVNQINTDNAAAQYVLRELVNPYPGIMLGPGA